MAAAAGALLVDAQTGRVLLLRRTDDGTWAGPGGHLEAGEDAVTAADRELREEIAYSGLTFRPLLDVVRVTGGPIDYTLYVVEVPEAFDPRLNFEHDDWGWFLTSELPEPLHPGLCAVFTAEC